jgi:hypothetical protein
MGCFSHLHNFLVLVSTTNSYPKLTLVISRSQSWLKPHLVTSLDFVTKTHIWATHLCCCIAWLVCTCHECLSMKVFDSRDALPIPVFLPTHRAIQPLFNNSWAQEPLTKGASKSLKVQGEASFGDIPKIRGLGLCGCWVRALHLGMVPTYGLTHHKEQGKGYHKPKHTVHLICITVCCGQVDKVQKNLNGDQGGRSKPISERWLLMSRVHVYKAICSTNMQQVLQWEISRCAHTNLRTKWPFQLMLQNFHLSLWFHEVSRWQRCQDGMLHFRTSP